MKLPFRHDTENRTGLEQQKKIEALQEQNLELRWLATRMLAFVEDFAQQDELRARWLSRHCAKLGIEVPHGVE